MNCIKKMVVTFDIGIGDIYVAIHKLKRLLEHLVIISDILVIRLIRNLETAI